MQVPDGLMVSGTSAIYSKNPSPGSPRAGASSCAWRPSQPITPSLTMTATVGELGPNPVRHLARCGTAMLAARFYAREATNQGGQMRVLLACAIIITTAVGLAGCFHHQQATYAEPIARPPLK